MAATDYAAQTTGGIRPKVWPFALLLVVAIGAAYSNALHGPFVFDDLNAIPLNPSNRRLWSSEIFAPPAGLTVSGRPLLNASLALNYAFGGENVRGYHVTNILIHALAALTLCGVLRRTFAPTRLRGVFADESSAVRAAFVATLLWALHPLQTESVTYVIQRAESLMGLFYLLTLYAFVRALDAPRPRWWHTLSVVACAAGMATKEVMITAPLVVFCYDRVFNGATGREIWRQRGPFYLSLAATWSVLLVLMWPAAGRAGTAGFSTGVSMAGYALTQCGAVLRYLRLAAWPHPLVFDYGEYAPPEPGAALSEAVLLVALLAAVIFFVRRRPAAGLAVAAFLLVLAPTSSVVPVLTEPVAEHRMYLPLAALCALAATACQIVTKRPVGTAVLMLVAVGGGVLTFQHNELYRSERALWTATVDAVPHNGRAHGSLARALIGSGEPAAAESHFRTALALRPDYIDARHGLAELLASRGQLAEAMAHYEAILRVRPNDFVAHHALGTLSFQRGDLHAAAAHFTDALRIRPESAAAHNNLGCVFFESGDLASARVQEETAIRLQPDYAEAHYNLGNVAARQSASREALGHYERALQLAPNYMEAHLNLAAVLQSLGERTAAIAHYRAALQLRPDNEFARRNLMLLGGFEAR